MTQADASTLSLPTASGQSGRGQPVHLPVPGSHSLCPLQGELLPPAGVLPPRPWPPQKALRTHVSPQGIAATAQCPAQVDSQAAVFVSESCFFTAKQGSGEWGGGCDRGSCICWLPSQCAQQPGLSWAGDRVQPGLPPGCWAKHLGRPLPVWLPVLFFKGYVGDRCLHASRQGVEICTQVCMGPGEAGRAQGWPGTPPEDRARGSVCLQERGLWSARESGLGV